MVGDINITIKCRVRKMKHIVEGLDVLDGRKIPYNMMCCNEGKDVCLVKISGIVIEQLRDLGFRVGKEVIDGEKVVFYKGKFFGLTAG